VLKGEGGAALIESYDTERIQAADENIGHSTRSTDFMSPHTSAERRLRDAVLSLAPQAEFARRMVNSGRLSLPAIYDTPLSTPDAGPFAGSAKLGAPLPDAPLRRADGTATHLLDNLRGAFAVIHVKNGAADGHKPEAVDGIALTVIGDDVLDDEGKFTRRFDATPGATYLIRPDQHLCARWRGFDAAASAQARDRALQR
jgi:3-(3-hydroxy-phenyl)propionate hydroxylase